jgi:hypothetical protein
MHRFLLLVVLVAASQSVAVGQSTTGSEGVYTLQGKAYYEGGFWSKQSWEGRGNLCLPIERKRIRLVIGNDGLTFNDWGSPRSGCLPLTIPYKNIVVLSRGSIVGTWAKVGQYGTIAASLGSLLFGTLKSTREVTDTTVTTTAVKTTSVPRGWQALTLGFAGAAVAAGVIWFKGLGSHNYIAISFDTSKDSTGCQQPTSVTAAAGGKPSPSETKPADSGKDAPLFHKGNLAMFWLTNRHDYWNISMILSSATGCEFVSEEAEKK